VTNTYTAAHTIPAPRGLHSLLFDKIVAPFEVSNIEPIASHTVAFLGGELLVQLDAITYVLCRADDATDDVGEAIRLKIRDIREDSGVQEEGDLWPVADRFGGTASPVRFSVSAPRQTPQQRRRTREKNIPVENTALECVTLLQ